MTTLNNFAYFLNNATQDDFINVWGGDLGKHFWRKYYAGGEFNMKRLIRDVSDHNWVPLENHLKEFNYKSGKYFSKED